MINAKWHAAHRMPKNATPAQRLAWHEQHAKHCGCRPFTAAMRAKLTAAAKQKKIRRAG
jgi:hypothetical protein